MRVWKPVTEVSIVYYRQRSSELRKIMNIIAKTLLISILATGTLPQTLIAAPAKPPAKAAAGTGSNWNVDKGASRVGFRSSFGGGAFDGVFRRWDARIQFDPKALDKSSVVASIDLASAATGDDSRDQALPTPDWFFTGKFPRATFSARQFKETGAGRYQAIGTLNIRGVTRPAVLPFTLQINGDQALMKGSLTIDRKAFGIGQGQFATAESVPFGVQVSVTVKAQRAR